MPHDITYLFHGHTHRGHHSIQWVQNEYGKWHVRHYIGVPPTYVDPNVRKPFAGWVSLLEIDGEAQVFMHALTNKGARF